jgi:hypothetical protein
MSEAQEMRNTLNTPQFLSKKTSRKKRAHKWDRDFDMKRFKERIMLELSTFGSQT